MMNKYIKLVIIPKNDGENGIGDAAESIALGPVSVSTERPSVSGIAYGGQTVLAQDMEGFAVGGKIEVDYIYTHNYGTAEDKTKTRYQWYTSFTPAGKLTAIEGATDSTFTPTEAEAGKYIRVGVTPAAIDGSVGDEFVSEGLLVRWKLTFFDEFNYEAKDGYDPQMTAKWSLTKEIRPIGSPMIYQIRIPDNTEVTNGRLYIHNRKEHLDTLGDGTSTADLDKKIKDEYGYAGGHEWTTANLISKDAYGPEGYYEASYKYAAVTGLNQSFWAMSFNTGYNNTGLLKNDIELDFNEGHYPNAVTSTTHFYNDYGGAGGVSITPVGPHNTSNITTPNLSTDFHKYAGYFKQFDPSSPKNQGTNANSYRTYFDDAQFRSSGSGADDICNPVYIYLSIAIFPGWTGPFDPNTDGSAMEVDYVRFYEPLGATKTSLENLVQSAEEYIEGTVVGTEAGNYPQNAVDALNALLPAAKAVLEQDNPSQDDINQQVDSVSQGIDEFLSKAVGDRSVVSGLIGEAEKLLERYPEGTGFMQCMSGIYKGLKEAADLAKVVVNSPYPTQSELDEKIGPLETMLARFMNGVNFSGTTNGDQTIDLRETSRMADITIRAEDTPEILLPDTVKAEIKITRQLSKDISVKITIPKDAELRGEFKLPKDAEASSQEWTIENSIEMGGVKSSKPVRIELNGKNDSKIGVIRRTGENSGIIEEITKTIREDSQGAAEAALNEATKVVRVEGSLVLYTLETEDYAVYRTKETESPSPTPSATPDDNHNNNNNNSWSPGGNLTPGIWLPGSNGNNKVKFKDIAGHWAEEEIKELAKEGTIKGRSETEYEPEGTVTRAEFAAMITRALGMNAQGYRGGYNDVKPGEWYAEEIQAIVDAGIMSGDADGTFRPNEAISREEMAKVIVNAYKLKTGNNAPETAEVHFSDAETISGWAREYVRQAAGLGLMQGMNDGRFDPMGNATRAQSAVVIFRLGK